MIIFFSKSSLFKTFNFRTFLTKNVAFFIKIYIFIRIVFRKDINILKRKELK